MYFNGTILAVLDNFFGKQAYYVKVLYQNAKAAAPKLPKLPEAVESEMDDVLKVNKFVMQFSNQLIIFVCRFFLTEAT